jgi:hypothetical protein
MVPNSLKQENARAWIPTQYKQYKRNDNCLKKAQAPYNTVTPKPPIKDANDKDRRETRRDCDAQGKTVTECRKDKRNINPLLKDLRVGDVANEDQMRPQCGGAVQSELYPTRPVQPRISWKARASSNSMMVVEWTIVRTICAPHRLRPAAPSPGPLSESSLLFRAMGLSSCPKYPPRC